MLTESVPADLAATVDRIENWAAWARERTGGSIIGSAEGRYRPERGDQEPRRKPRMDIDALDAQIVGKCLAPAGGFPHRWYVMLKWRYLYHSSRQVLCRKMAIHGDSYAGELNKALCSARNVLSKRKC